MLARSTAALIGVGVLLLFSGCGGADNNGENSKAECKDGAEPAPKEASRLKAPSRKLNPSETYAATVTTSCGTFVIELDTRQAPKTTASFVSLADNGFYDGLTFHRIAPGFVIQGGDPKGDGSGGPGYKVRERPPNDLVYSRGMVAMAKAPNEPAGTSGSQFFVVTADSSLPPEYALLGRVTEGFDAVQAIEAQASPEAPDGPPIKPIVIESIRISGGRSAQ